MEFLDLTRDDPRDVEGKLVAVEEGVYQIGSYLGSQADKITYKLVNKKSGLCLHVITFWSVPEEAGQVANRTGNREDEPSRGPAHTRVKGATHSRIVRGHGATFLLHDYPGAFENEANETYRLWKKANELLEASQFAGAATLYREVLLINPYHTVALSKLSYVQRKLGNVEHSRHLLSSAIEIEPNHLPYQQAYMRVAATCGYVRDSLEHFEAMKSRFPHQCDDDALAINLYLRSGRPEKAKALLEQARIDPLGRNGNDAFPAQAALQPSERTRLQEATDAAIKAKEQARLLMTRAERLTKSGTKAGVLELLEKAYSIYEKDPFLVMNLAFALARANELNRAGFLLLSVASIVPPSLAKVCYANSAFNEIKDSRLDIAIRLLEETAYLVLAESPEREEIDIHTLPGIGVWIGEQPNEEYFLVEERIRSAYELIDRAVTQYAQRVPPAVERLAGWYRQAAS